MFSSLTWRYRYIGSHTVLELLKENYNVLLIDDLSNSFESVLHRIKTLAQEHFANLNRCMPELHFHRVDYRHPSMRSILANYSTYTIDNPIIPSTADTPIEEMITHLPESKDHSSLPTFGVQTLSPSESTVEVSANTVQRQSKISGVIHFAAFKSVEESIRDPLRYYSNNVCGMVDFLVFLSEFGIKNFVFSSSATVYGDWANSGIPLIEEYCVHHPETYEDDNGREQTSRPGALGLTSPYGRTKFFCESVLADVARSDPSWSITSLRYFNPVGDLFFAHGCNE